MGLLCEHVYLLVRVIEWCQHVSRLIFSHHLPQTHTDPPPYAGQVLTETKLSYIQAKRGMHRKKLGGGREGGGTLSIDRGHFSRTPNHDKDRS